MTLRAKVWPRTQFIISIPRRFSSPCLFAR